MLPESLAAIIGTHGSSEEDHPQEETGPPETTPVRRSAPHLTVVTLGVHNLARSRAFYCDGLGFRASSSSNESIVFMDAGGIVLALYRRKLLTTPTCRQKGRGSAASPSHAT